MDTFVQKREEQILPSKARERFIQLEPTFLMVVFKL